MTKAIGPEAKLFNAVDEMKEATKEAHATLKQLSHSINEAKKLATEIRKTIDAGVLPLIADRMDKIESDMQADQERLMAEIIECLETVTLPIRSALESHR